MGFSLAAIPYRTLPGFDIGPLDIRVFGLVVAAGVFLGALVAARHAERFGVSRDAIYRLGLRMVVFGFVGARLTWVLSHWNELDGPVDAIAVWQGGLQFSGGFVAAVIVGLPTFRRWDVATRRHSLDGYALGLSVGLAFGRLACLSVGEHFGRTTEFALGVQYRGGPTQEDTLGAIPLEVGQVFHQTALYEFLYLAAIYVVLRTLLHRAAMPPGGAIALFCVTYGVSRFAWDSLRVNDERFLGLTGAQFLSVGLVVTGVWLLLGLRRTSREDTRTMVGVA